MGDIEMAQCDFCKQTKPVVRTYVYPSNYEKPKSIEERAKLYNEGDYFLCIKTCVDCGEPTEGKS